MTFFLHVPELEEGITDARNAMGLIDESESEKQRLKLVSMLDAMLEFAETNLKEMLTLMGFSSIEELNSALQNYNNLNLSLQQLFPAFSEPMITEVLARYEIGKQGGQAPQYELVTSIIEDSIRRRFPAYMENKITIDKVAQALQNDQMAASIAGDVAAVLFGGESLQATIPFNLNRGTFNFSDFITEFNKIINNAKKTRGISGTTKRTAVPFITDLLIPLIKEIGNSDNLLLDQKEGLIDYKEVENIMIRIINEKDSKTKKFFSSVLNERVLRGGMRIATDTGVDLKTNGDNIQIVSYLNYVTCNIDPSLFNLSERGNLSIEKYVEQQCTLYPELRTEIIAKLQNFYWNIIFNYLPPNTNSPMLQKEFNELISNMAAPSPEGNIGWFFSQGTTKAGGSGMFGEIAGMIYVSLLCPNLKENARLIWAGGVTGDAKPPADIVLGTALKDYGIQVKNYTSGSILSHDYALRIKNIVDSAAADNSNNKLDLMTLQATTELGITPEEIEAVQNVIIANTFNVPYEYDSSKKMFVPGHPEGFTEARADLTSAFEQATRYMAVISVIMHRLQYAEEITRQVSATRQERQLQNTLWLINGSMFVSSVQILHELRKYVLESVNRFFNISTSVRIKGDKLPEGIKEGNMTIIEYYNYSAKGLGTTALSKVSARIGTNYRMSAFNP